MKKTAISYDKIEKALVSRFGTKADKVLNPSNYRKLAVPDKTYPNLKKTEPTFPTDTHKKRHNIRKELSKVDLVLEDINQSRKDIKNIQN